jgi:2-dehydro-3-deoxyphosphogluconate aldolase/(4S)-4-hydroxy-2-oxoglutarate aldolase
MPTKDEVCARIREIGILPGIRVPSAADALFVAGEMLRWGISVVELTMTIPGAIDVIAELSRTMPHLIVGAGTVLDVETAAACIDAGAAFVTSPGLNRKLVEFTVGKKVAAMPGALTPTEVMAAVDAGADLIKIFPCDAVGGPEYLRSLRAPFPHIDFIASGGVDQVNASEFIRAGAAALGIRGRLMPQEAIQRRDQNWIRELSGRFLGIVQRTRAEFPRQSVR